jgi:putative ABC transport system permease protein
VTRWLLIVRLRLRSLFRRDRVEHDLDDELRDHLARSIEQGLAVGLSPDQARTAALRNLGGLQPLKEHLRDARNVGMVEDLLRDVRHGIRLLRRSPTFTFVAVLSLALGIGANAAIFQLVDAVRLRSLPVRAPHELAIVRIANRDWPPGNYGGRYPDVTHPIWDQIRSQQQAFSSIAAWSQTTRDLASQGESRFLENVLFVSGGFFATLRVDAAAGRLLAAPDDTPECASPAVVLSHGFWQRQFNASPSAIEGILRSGNRARVRHCDSAVCRCHLPRQRRPTAGAA